MALHFAAELKLNADKDWRRARVRNGQKSDKDGLAEGAFAVFPDPPRTAIYPVASPANLKVINKMVP